MTQVPEQVSAEPQTQAPAVRESATPAALEPAAAPATQSPVSETPNGAAPVDDPDARFLVRLDQSPSEWLPKDETLRYVVEATFGPIRSLDVGKVFLRAWLPPDEREAGAQPADASQAADGTRQVASIVALATGSVMGHEMIHRIDVRWLTGLEPRVEMIETRRGSRVGNRELRLGESRNGWHAFYRKDKHCRKCEDQAHVVEGSMPWSDPSHCDGCLLPEHRIWGYSKDFAIPVDSVDIVSALFVSRRFLKSGESEALLSIVQHDDLWRVRIKRGERQRIETPAGTFNCVRILISPELAVGEGLKGDVSKRFEALFGLHGSITVWVDAQGAFPVSIEGEAPVGPFEVFVRASLLKREIG